MYGGEGQDDQEQIRALYEERRQIVDKYDLGREDGAVIDDWEDPKLEIYHKTDRFGFITDSRLPDTLYRKVLKRVLSRLHRCNGRNTQGSQAILSYVRTYSQSNCFCDVTQLLIGL